MAPKSTVLVPLIFLSVSKGLVTYLLFEYHDSFVYFIRTLKQKIMTGYTTLVS